MIKEIPVKIQKYLKTRKIQLTFKVNYISLVKKDTIFRGLSDKPKTHSIRWHATMKRELLCTSRRARAFPTYTTRPFYVVRQSFVDKFRVSELRSTNSKDEPWDQETLHRACTMTISLNYIWIPLTTVPTKTEKYICFYDSSCFKFLDLKFVILPNDFTFTMEGCSKSWHLYRQMHSSSS